MLRPASTSEILPLLRGQLMSRANLRVYCFQAGKSDCFAYEFIEGEVIGFGGFYPAPEYLECWFMTRPELARPAAMIGLVKALRMELTVRAVIGRDDSKPLLMVSCVRFDNSAGQKIAKLLGFLPGPEYPDRPEVQQWVFPVLK